MKVKGDISSKRIKITTSIGYQNSSTHKIHSLVAKKIERMKIPCDFHRMAKMAISSLQWQEIPIAAEKMPAPATKSLQCVL